MKGGFKTKKRSEEWSSISGRGAKDTPLTEFRLYRNDTMWTVEDTANRNRHLKLWKGREPHQQSADFIKLAGTIRERQRSVFERVRGTVIRFLLAVMLVDLIRTMYQNKDRISRPPGSTLFAIADFFCSKKTVGEVVTPLIADMQFEYNEALAGRRKHKAKWIRVRGCWSFFKALGMHSILKTFVEMWRKISSV